MEFIDKMKKFFKSKIGIIIISVIVFLILLVVVFAMFFIDKKIKTKTINEKIYQVNGDVVLEFDADIEIDSKKNMIVGLYKNKKKLSTSSNPIYYYNSHKVIFPESMIAVFPYKHMQQYKVKYFTTATKSGDSVYLNLNNSNYLLMNAFLFDGDNLYFFVDETKITYNNKEIILPALSYVVMRYDSTIEVYNYGENINFKENVLSDKVYAECNNYKIDLGIDLVTVNNESSLLLGNVDSLENLK